MNKIDSQSWATDRNAGASRVSYYKNDAGISLKISIHHDSSIQEQGYCKVEFLTLNEGWKFLYSIPPVFMTSYVNGLSGYRMGTDFTSSFDTDEAILLQKAEELLP